MKLSPIRILIAAALLTGTATAQAPPAGPIDICGIVLDDPINPGQCTFIQDSNGVIYLPDDGAGGLPIGSMVNVTGDYDPSCFAICFGHSGCIFGATTTLGGCNLGTNFCMSSANSTGSAAVISASGSESVAANDLVIDVSSVPNEPGIVYYGPNELLGLPFGNGTRCVGGSVHRLPPMFAAGNTLTYAIDNTNLPSGGDFVAGGTWKFQGWFRDPAAGGAGFDLSDGLSITFGI